MIEVLSFESNFFNILHITINQYCEKFYVFDFSNIKNVYNSY